MALAFDILTSNSGPRLVARRVLRPDADFDAIAGKLAEFGITPFRAIKSAPVAARRVPANRPSVKVVTHYNGVETRNVAKPGDWIVTSLDLDERIMRDAQGHKNVYVISPENFDRLYERRNAANEDGLICYPTGEEPIDVLYFPGGFDIVAPWGERQQAPAGYLARTARTVYGIHGEAFELTYSRLQEAT